MKAPRQSCRSFPSKRYWRGTAALLLAACSSAPTSAPPASEAAATAVGTPAPTADAPTTFNGAPSELPETEPPPPATPAMNVAQTNAAQPASDPSGAFVTEPDPLIVDDSVLGGDDDSAPGESCAVATSTAELQPLVLGVAFDVSGSMGKGDEPYHDRVLKWDPVVAATRAFFESSDMVRVSASLTFFPADDDRCDVERYLAPDVPLEQLPSARFAEAITLVTPTEEDDWRGGTPTVAVLEGTLSYLETLAEADPNAKYAAVLITDGTPQGCSDDVDSVTAVGAAAARVSEQIPTYVIGVENPATDEEPDPPDNVGDLHQIAEQGGSGQAFLIQTGDPELTATRFSEVVQSIRNQGLSCELPIPDVPDGMSVDLERVNASWTTPTERTELGFSENCSADDSWRFDDEANPRRLVLCPETCARIQSLPDVQIEVEFGCQRRRASVR